MDEESGASFGPTFPILRFDDGAQEIAVNNEGHLRFHHRGRGKGEESLYPKNLICLTFLNKGLRNMGAPVYLQGLLLFYTINHIEGTSYFLHKLPLYYHYCLKVRWR